MNEKINSYNAFVDAHSNLGNNYFDILFIYIKELVFFLAVLFLIEGDKYKAYEYCQKTLNLDSNNYEAYINLGDVIIFLILGFKTSFFIYYYER
jgi:hypothetical protein